MKNVIFPFVIVLACAVALFGCGKSAEMKTMEADLYASVTKMHDGGMELMKKATDMAGSIDETLAQCEKLATEHPKEFAGHTDVDLKAAKEKLTAAVTSMKAWMADFKPYDENMKHEDVLAQLNKSKDGIAKVTADFNAALSAGTAALDAHKAEAEELMAKLTKTAKKVTKK